MTLPSSRFVCWNVTFLHQKLKTSVQADAEHWGYCGRCQSLNENTKWIFLIFRFISTTNTSFEFSIHSTQQSKHFNVFLTFSLRYCPGCVRMPDLTSKAALYSSSNHKSVFLSHQRLPTPLSFDSAIKRRCKNRGNGSLLVLVTEARDV